MNGYTELTVYCDDCKEEIDLSEDTMIVLVNETESKRICLYCLEHYKKEVLH